MFMEAHGKTISSMV
jgi:hypothetical protein